MKYLSAEQVDLVWGAQFDVLPVANLASLGFEALDETAGLSESLAAAGLGPFRDALTTGLGRMNEMLDPKPQALFEIPLTDLLDGTIAALVARLKKSWPTDPV